MTVRTVLWDADGVLQRVPGGWEESMRPALEGRVDDITANIGRLAAREPLTDVVAGENFTEKAERS